MNRLRTFCLCFCFCLAAGAQTAVLFPLAQMTGITNDTTITIKPVNDPVSWRGRVWWLPPSGIQLNTLNGEAVTNLIPNDYIVSISGVVGTWKISVADTNVTENAALIGTLTTYTFDSPVPGVMQIIPGNNVSISPGNGVGVVTINSLGGSGGSATNAYQSGTASGRLTIVTNAQNFTYLFDVPIDAFDAPGSAMAATNGWPWGVLYDAAGAARGATNGYPWGALYDAAGSATASTNGWPWGTLYDAAGSATAATNGWPWGVLYDAAGAAHNATNGYPWGTLYDAAGSATAATNGWPWGTRYDADGSATAATNGYPWGALYDASGSAHNATNGYPWGALYDAAGSSTAATNGLGIGSGDSAFVGTNRFAPAANPTFTGTMTGNGLGVTNLTITNLSMSLIIGSGSNNVVGYLRFTNNGIYYTIPVCTNAAP